ncbi:MAG: thiol-disulfide oxidoreductase DCC family protein [Marinomonas colpomeniae]
MLTIFYDGYCPLCAAEMKQLQSLDVNKKLTLEDIHASDFSDRFPHIDPIEADKRLHGQLENGQIITGLDVTCLSWKLVGKHKWMQVLRWPVIRIFADLGYRFFARYRHQLSSFISGKSRGKDNCLPCQK